MKHSEIKHRLRNVRAIAEELIHHAPHSRDEWQETLTDHARHLGTATRQRVKLVAAALFEEVHETASKIKSKGKHASRNARASAVMYASRKLGDLAERLEKKAQAIK